MQFISNCNINLVLLDDCVSPYLLWELVSKSSFLTYFFLSQCCQHKTNERDSVIRKTGTAEENSSVTVFGFIHRTKMYSMILTFLVVLVCKVCRCYFMSCHSENSDATCSWSETKKLNKIVSITPQVCEWQILLVLYLNLQCKIVFI